MAAYIIVPPALPRQRIGKSPASTDFQRAASPSLCAACVCMRVRARDVAVPPLFRRSSRKHDESSRRGRVRAALFRARLKIRRARCLERPSALEFENRMHSSVHRHR